LALPLPTLHLGVSFASKEIIAHAAIHLGFLQGQEVTLTLNVFESIANGSSISFAIAYGFSAPEQNFAILNVTLLSYPNPSNLIQQIPTVGTAIPFIKESTLLFQGIGDSPTTINWCYSAFA
jgi:hypothetical protein